MSERVIDRVAELADQFKEQAVEAEKLGQLPEATVKNMKSIGSIRLLQPERHGGLEVHPREWAETVMATAALDPAAGWVNGVVGVHPYQFAYADPRVAEEVWARRRRHLDRVALRAAGHRRCPSTAGTSSTVGGSSAPAPTHATGSSWAPWSATPTAKPVMPPQILHMILPRKDYEIVADSWDVVGLRGTGSKDVIVKDAFVPAYRTMDGTKVMDGTAQLEAGMTKTLYKMPWSTMFPLGISSATIGICEGALAAHLDYQRERVGAAGTAIKDDPYVLYSIGEAAAEIDASRQALLANVDKVYDIVDAGREVTLRGARRGAPLAGAGGVARGRRRRPDLRPLRRQRAAHGQAAATLLARCARGHGARDPHARAPPTTRRR